MPAAPTAPHPRLIDLLATASPAELNEVRQLLGIVASTELPRLTYSPVEVASILGVSRSKVMALIASGELRSLKIDRCRRIHRDDIDAYLDGLRAEAAR